MSAIKDITGQTFGRLTIIDLSHTKNRKSFWNCVCLCGTKIITRADGLKSGHTKSCGCYHKDMSSSANKTHGLTKTPEYKAWTRMRERCLCKTDDSYRDYGGRGITICNKWLDSFAGFYADMGKRPSCKHSLERTNNAKGYSLYNCVWATRKQQQNNTRRNHNVTINGKTRTLAQWSEISGILQNTIHSRLGLGWTNEESVFKPTRR